MELRLRRLLPRQFTDWHGRYMIENDPEERWRHGMASILGELEQLYDRDEIGAVSISIALRDGNVRHLSSYDTGFRILLVAAAAIGLKNATDYAPLTPDPENWHEPDRRQKED